MKTALDTQRYVALCNGVEETARCAGFAIGRREMENERVLRRFMLKDGVPDAFR